MDRQTAAALDRYLTAGPPEPPEPVECSECSEEVPDKPFKKVEHVESLWCDGEPTVLKDQKHDESLLAVIGEAHRDDTFEIAYAPDCGHKDGDKYGRDPEEISPLHADEFKHKPHWYTPPLGVATTIYRKCPNGHVHEEVVV